MVRYREGRFLPVRWIGDAQIQKIPIPAKGRGGFLNSVSLGLER